MSLLRQLIVLCALGGLAYGGYEAYTFYTPNDAAAPAADRRGPREALVETVTAEIQTLQETVEAVGTTRAIRSVEIVPEADGRVSELLIVPGAEVAAGDALLRLDDTIERADLTEATARLDEAQKVATRLGALRKTSAVSEAALQEATVALAVAQAQVERARQRLSERTITAPFAGTVGLTDVTVGARVGTGTMITRLDDLSEVEVEFSSPETLFARIRPGQLIRATSAAFPGQEFTGLIEAIDTRIDPVSRAFRVRAVIPNPDHALPAGMFMSLELTLSEAAHVMVPEEALVFQAAETYVFVVDGDTARRVQVETGRRQDDRVAILTGIDAGAQVITRGLHRVRDGAPIKIAGTAGDTQ